MLLRREQYFWISKTLCRVKVCIFYIVWTWVGFIIVGPLVSEKANMLVMQVSFFRSVHIFFSGLGFFAIVPLFIYSVMMYFSSRLERGYFPGGWSYNLEGRWPSPCQVANRRLFPQSLKEEYVFITWVVGFFLYHFWVPQVVGGIISFSIITWSK